MDDTSTTDDRPAAPTEVGLSSLYQREYRPMVRMATLMVGSAPVAEEVVQDAFAVVGERWHDLDRPGAYLRTTVVNGCSQVLRRRAAEDRVSRLAPPPDDVVLPTRLIELRHALDRLTERQRMVIVLRYVVDVSDREIAEILSVRPSTVRSLARRAFAVLRKELS